MQNNRRVLTFLCWWALLLATVVHGQMPMQQAAPPDPAASDTRSVQVPGGTITGVGSYAPGSKATLKAEPAEGYSFSHWEGTGITSPNSPEITVVMDNDQHLKPVFNRDWNVIVTPDNPKGGQTTGSGNYPVGETVPITATANEGFTFQGWQGEGVADPKAPETTLTVSGVHNIVARFQSDDEQDQQNQQNQNQNQQQQNQDSQQDQQQNSQDQQNQQQQNQSQQDQQGDSQQNQDSSQSNEQEKSDDNEQKNSDKPEQAEQKQEQSEPEDSAEPQDESAEEMPTGGDEQSTEGEPQSPAQVVPGAMTREEAARLLDALQRGERKLPAGSVRRSNPESAQEGRDW